MREALKTQKNAEKLGSEKCRKGSEEFRELRGLRKMKEGLRAQKNEVGFKDPEECRGV